jgi:hypothetical protein
MQICGKSGVRRAGMPAPVMGIAPWRTRPGFPVYLERGGDWGDYML